MAVMKRILEREGYRVRCADSLACARAMYTELRPDGIILGKEAKDGSGLDYCRELRGISDLPIMFCSGDRADELAAFRCGASDFLKMPYDYDVLKARIYVMLSGNARESPNNYGSRDTPKLPPE
jgi:DNA-binding response OmpR family regulator